ncbi:MAG: sialidase family protein, partial [Saprospiraceae bacterium]
QEGNLSMVANLNIPSCITDAKNSEIETLTASNIIFQSTDGGQTWQDISAGLPMHMEADRFFANDNDIFLTSAHGLYHISSANNDQVWKQQTSPGVNIRDIFSTSSGLIGRTNTGATFQKMTNSAMWIPAYSTLGEHSVEYVFESRKGTLFATSRKGIYRSSDQGKSWKHVFDRGWVMEMTESNGVLICANERGILRSTDEGEHWELVISEGGVGIDVQTLEDGFAAISYNDGMKVRRVRMSSDGGQTWQSIDGGGLEPSLSIASITQVGEYLFCGHPDGIFRSSDQGKSWKLILPSIDKKVYNLSVSGGVLYAIPKNGGC